MISIANVAHKVHPLHCNLAQVKTDPRYRDHHMYIRSSDSPERKDYVSYNGKVDKSCVHLSVERKSHNAVSKYQAGVEIKKALQYYDDRWKQMPHIKLDNPDLNIYLEYYKVVDVDRSQCWQYVNHPKDCKDMQCMCRERQCRYKFCRCDCKSCIGTAVGMSSNDRWVYEQWLYLANQLQQYIDDAKDLSHAKALSTIDPWSLQRLWLCKVCFEVSVVEAYNNKGYLGQDVFYVCLSCLGVCTAEDMDDPALPHIRRPSYIYPTY